MDRLYECRQYTFWYLFEPAYYPWYKDPFGAVMDDEMEEAEELLMLRESAVAKAEFQNLRLSEFWLQQQDTYPRLCNKAAQMFLPFPTTYLCEAGFSVMFDLKPKKRNRLEMSSDMRLACSETKPNISKLVANCKEQVSHWNWNSREWVSDWLSVCVCVCLCEWVCLSFIIVLSE